MLSSERRKKTNPGGEKGGLTERVEIQDEQKEKKKTIRRTNIVTPVKCLEGRTCCCCYGDWASCVAMLEGLVSKLAFSSAPATCWVGFVGVGNEAAAVGELGSLPSPPAADA